MDMKKGLTAAMQHPAVRKSVQAELNEYVDAGGWRKRFDELLGKRAAQYISSVVTLVNSDTNLMDVFYRDPVQVIQCAIKAATYDLPLEKAFGFAYIIPFKGKPTFVLGYKGIIQLALRTNQYERINAIEVHEGELKSRDFLTEDFEFQWIDNPKERRSRPVIGYVAYYRLKNGMEKYLYMSKAEMQEHELQNRKGKIMSPLWRDRFDDMGKKTVLRLLLSKWGILSIDYQTAGQSAKVFENNMASGTLDDEDAMTIEADTEDPVRDVAPVNEMKEATPDPAEEDIPMDWGHPSEA